jgi:ABC-type antimicrobial peptide transport system permease subunit
MSIALQERKYELSLIGSIGGQPWQVVMLLLLASILIGSIGFLVSVLLFYTLMWLSNEYWSSDWGFGRMEIRIYAEQGRVLLLGLGLAVLSVIVPIIQVLRMDIARTLSER